LGRFGNTEINDLGDPAVVLDLYQDVRRLDVSVNDPLLVLRQEEIPGYLPRVNVPVGCVPPLACNALWVPVNRPRSNLPAKKNVCGRS
jgi:hypothetical protein